jgi:hypothetical protein
VPDDPLEGYRSAILSLFDSYIHSQVAFVSIEIKRDSFAVFEWPGGSYWKGVEEALK